MADVGGSWAWFLVFLVDFPISVLLLPLAKIADPFLVFGLFGTAWWFLISKLVEYVVDGSSITDESVEHRLAAERSDAPSRSREFALALEDRMMPAYKSAPGRCSRSESGTEVDSRRRQQSLRSSRTIAFFGELRLPDAHAALIVGTGR